MAHLNLIGESSARIKALTGAERLSGPKDGKDWTYLPSLEKAKASKSAAITMPCPPRPCSLISTIAAFSDLVLAVLAEENGDCSRARLAVRLEVFMPLINTCPQYLVMFLWYAEKATMSTLFMAV